MSTMSSTPRRSAELIRGLAAALLLLTFVIGVPAALLALAPVYLPASGLHWDQAWQRLMAPDDGSLLILVLAGAAWLCWAAFTLSVLLELVAGARRLSTPAIPLLGGFQRSAASLVAAAGVLLAVASNVATAAAPAAATSIVAADVPRAVTPATAATETRAVGPSLTPSGHSPGPAMPAQQLPTITVVRGDTLWDLAERHLGAGTRYTEIRDLNAHRTQPDGRTLANADWILPGWTLVLPADAHDVPQASEAPRTPAAEPATMVVQPGDTLSEIAQRELGDAHRYSDIVALNGDRTQPDGTALSNPDLIRPGWVLALPPAATAASHNTTGGDPPPGASVPPPLSAQANDSASPAAEPSGPPSAAAAADPVPKPEDDARRADPRGWYLGFTALGAAGVIGEIARRRKLQQRARRVGETIPMPSPASTEARAERTLRTAPAPVSIATLTTTLANLGCRCFDAGRELPRVGALLLNERHLTLLLVEDAPDPVPPFTATDARTWTANTADVAAEEAMDDPEQCIPYPLLVTLGHTEDATLIANLEAAGTLAVTGDDMTADGVLHALVLEAATSELANQTPIRVDESLADLAASFEDFRLRPADDRDDPVALQHEISAVLAAHGLDDTLQSRGDRTLPDTWHPEVHVERSLQRPPNPPWSGVVTITREATVAGWTIRTKDDGLASLDPFGIEFQPQRLSPDQLEQLQGVLLAAMPPEPQPTLTQAQTEVDDDIEALRGTLPSAIEEAEASPGVTINVLGPVEIKGLAADAPPLTPRMTEVLVYLALHGPVTGADLDEVLWGGERVRPGTRAQLLFRTRERVGKSVLPTFQDDGRFGLGPAASTDWARFERLVTQAVSTGGDARMEHLSEALGLVRDRPFRGIASSEYPWADYDIQRMTSAVADAATVLAQLFLEASRDREALEVALKGLTVEPLCESLQHVAIAATRELVGSEGALELRHRFAAQMARLDPELA